MVIIVREDLERQGIKVQKETKGNKQVKALY